MNSRPDDTLAQLTAAGITDIQHDKRCTMESPELYSYRRDKSANGFAGYIWLGHDSVQGIA